MPDDVPSAQEIIASLSAHPEVYAEVVRHGALLLVDNWVSGSGHGVRNRHLACQPRSSDTRVAQIGRLDAGTGWVAQVDDTTEHPTEEAAMEYADQRLRRIGYLVIDAPFTVRRAR